MKEEKYNDWINKNNVSDSNTLELDNNRNR